MKILKPYFWDNKNISFMAYLLIPLSIIIRWFVITKKYFGDKKYLNIRTICVGNIYIGGTGKTPLTIKIAKNLNKKKKAVIVKKFYKNHLDEIDLIKKNFKLFSGPNRLESIKQATKKNYDIVILDDGLQDHTFHKDCEIVCVSANLGFGNKLTIPAGPLREPINSLKRSNIVMINYQNKKKIKEVQNQIIKINSEIKIFTSKYIINQKNIKNLKRKKFIAFAGIGNPDHFFYMLKKYKFDIKKQLTFPDHYSYSKNELQNLLAKAKKGKLNLITTEKDYYRIKHLKIKNIHYLPVILKIDNEKKFFKEIEKFI